MTSTTLPRSSVGALAAITAGAGPTVLLIHGVGLCADAWTAQIEALAGQCHILAVDMPGHGASVKFERAPVLADYTDAIAAVLSDPAVVIGHSFGAMIALDLARKYPEKVSAVVALNAIYRRDDAAKAAVQARADSLDGCTLADPTATLDRWFGSVPCAARTACDGWLRGVDPAGYRNAYRVFAAQDGPSNEDLQNLHCPALFVTGAEEPNSTPTMSRAMAALAPHGRAEIVPGAAHMLPMTHSDQVNAILQAFMAEAAP